MDSWFGSLQKGFADAAEKASAYAKEASAQAAVLAERAAEQAKVLAEKAAVEARAKYDELHAMSQAAPAGGSHSLNDTPEELMRYGVTEEVIEYAGNMTYSTFSDYPLDTLPSVNPLGVDALTNDPDNFKLSPWQTRHCMLILSRVTQLQHLRFALCPKRLSEQEFWTVYFTMTKRMLPPEAFGLPPAPGSIGAADAAATKEAAEKEATEAHATGSAKGSDSAATASSAAKESPAASSKPPNTPSSPEKGDRDHEDLAAALSGGVSDAEGDGEDEERYDDVDDVDLDDADLDKLNDLENDPELAAYLKEALEVNDDDPDDGGEMSDLGSGIDDLDDYINQLDDELGSEEVSPTKTPKKYY